jgi:hypothetical protein
MRPLTNGVHLPNPNHFKKQPPESSQKSHHVVNIIFFSSFKITALVEGKSN